MCKVFAVLKHWNRVVAEAQRRGADDDITYPQLYDRPNGSPAPRHPCSRPGSHDRARVSARGAPRSWQCIGRRRVRASHRYGIALVLGRGVLVGELACEPVEHICRSFGDVSGERGVAPHAV